MDVFWSWFYEQLEKQPEEEVERLQQAAEQAVEAPLGREPQVSARLLQSRIGNQAMQRLVQMKSQQQGRQRPQLETEQTSEQAPEQIPKQPQSIEQTQRLTAVAEQAEAPELNEVIEEVPQTEQQSQQQTATQQLDAIVERSIEPSTVTEPTKEEQLALALRRFITSLGSGGGTLEWIALSDLFLQVNNAAQQKVLNALTETVFTLEQSTQRLLMKNVIAWRQGAGDDDLATKLWLRLFKLLPVTESHDQGETDTNTND